MNHNGLQYKSIQHFEARQDVHFLTFSCADRRPLLISDDIKMILAASIQRAIKAHPFDLFAFVLMPEHVHLLVHPTSTDGSISKLLWTIKRPASFHAKAHIAHDVTRPFHLWQAGPGYDANLRSWESVDAAADYIHMNPVRRGLASSPQEYRWSSARQWATVEASADPSVPRITRRR